MLTPHFKYWTMLRKLGTCCGVVLLHLVFFPWNVSLAQSTGFPNSRPLTSGTTLVPIQKQSHSKAALPTTGKPNLKPGTLKPAGTENVTELKVTSRFHIVGGSNKGYLIVKAQIPAGSYIYSLTQAGDIPPTKIDVGVKRGFKIVGKFAADRTFELVPFDPVMKTRVEKHKKLVQFYAPIQLEAGVDPAKLKPELKFETQICSDLGFCKPVRDLKLVAKFGGFFQEQAKSSDRKNVRKR